MALHSIKKKGQNAFQFAHFPPVDRKNAFNYSASALHFNRNYYNFISWFKEKIKKRKREREKIRIDFAAVDSSLTKLSRHFICKCASHLPEQLREIMNTFTAQYGRLDVFSTPPAAPTPVADVRHEAVSAFAFSKFKFGDLSRDPVSSDLPIVTPVVTRIRWRSGRLK